MSDISVPSDKIEEIKEEMQKEFDNIINEVQIIIILTQTMLFVLHIIDVKMLSGRSDSSIIQCNSML